MKLKTKFLLMALASFIFPVHTDVAEAACSEAQPTLQLSLNSTSSSSIYLDGGSGSDIGTLYVQYGDHIYGTAGGTSNDGNLNIGSSFPLISGKTSNYYNASVGGTIDFEYGPVTENGWINAQIDDACTGGIRKVSVDIQLQENICTITVIGKFNNMENQTGAGFMLSSPGGITSNSDDSSKTFSGPAGIYTLQYINTNADANGKWSKNIEYNNSNYLSDATNITDEYNQPYSTLSASQSCTTEKSNITFNLNFISKAIINVQ